MTDIIQHLPMMAAVHLRATVGAIAEAAAVVIKRKRYDALDFSFSCLFCL